MKIDALLKQLQQQPYKTRIRIMWGTTVVLAVILLSIWVFSIKKEIANLDGQNLLGIQESHEAAAQEAKYVKVERIEQSSTSFKIFFSVNNMENDILNFSSNTEVELVVDDLTIQPLRILDRQNKPFVQKILSKTENFGILVFPQVDQDSLTLSFKDLYFENRPDKIFKESIPLDVSELKKNQELRK